MLDNTNDGTETTERGGNMAQVKDPVCGMIIEEEDAVTTSDYQGKRYYFCSEDCKGAFDQSSEDYVDTADKSK